MADLDIRLGELHYAAYSEIRIEGSNLICFPDSQYHMFISLLKGANSIVKLNGVHSQICSSLDPPLSIKKTESEMQKFIQVVEDNRKRVADSHKNSLVAYALSSH